MSTPRVSVIIAAYNAAELLPETLASVEAQTFPDFEIVVVDDGSTDATPSVLEQHAKSSSRLRWVRTENAGVAAAREHAIALARGDLIAFVDADDLWMPHKLAAQVPLFDDSGVGFAYTDVREFSSDGDAAQAWFQLKVPARGEALYKLFDGNFVCTSSVVVRKDALAAVGGFDRSLRLNEDYDLWLKIANQFKFDYVDEVLVRKRIIKSSLTHVYPMQCYVQDLRSIDHWVAARPDLFPAESAYVRLRRARAHSRMGYFLLHEKDFAGARRAYRQSLALGQVDRTTIVRYAAALAPPLAHLFWFAKKLRAPHSAAT